MHAALILFALYISTGREVVVLTPHPPQRLNPHNVSYYQKIEEPWFNACWDENEFRIMFANPETEATKDYIYQYWPVDCVADWTAHSPGVEKAQHWRKHVWDAVLRLAYQSSEPQQRRKCILEELYLYGTGTSMYWPIEASNCSSRFRAMVLFNGNARPLQITQKSCTPKKTRPV